MPVVNRRDVHRAARRDHQVREGAAQPHGGEQRVERGGVRCGRVRRTNRVDGALAHEATTALPILSAMAASPDPRKNQLLAALPAVEWARWLPALEAVSMPLGHVLYESGMAMSHVYFPTTSIVSLLYVMEDGASAEIAVVGNEGIVGVSLFMGGESTPSRSVVQSAGQGFRLPGALLKEEFNRSGPVLHLLLRYTQALITQMAQTAVCNRHHSLDQQLCRWLLLSLDRLEAPDLVMTQELIANMLGVRREGVTEAAANLQRAGLIRYRRGHITVLDRSGLEQRTCECYGVVKKEYERLLPVRTAR
jgi:CRP-like cAMP-binding protein